jgi:hypothetical protein
MYAIFFTTQGPSIKVAVPKEKFVDAKFLQDKSSPKT